MGNGFIRLSEVLDQMDRLDDSGRPKSFDMKFVTADRKRNTGGEIIEIRNGRKCVGKRNGKVIYDTRETVAEVRQSRSPNHWTNQTRNIILPNGAIRKVHIRLIIEFNGTKVCY